MQLKRLLYLRDPVALVECPGQLVRHIVGKIERLHRIRVIRFDEGALFALVIPYAGLDQLLQRRTADFVDPGIGQKPVFRKINLDGVRHEGRISCFGQVLLDVFDQPFYVFGGLFGRVEDSCALMPVFVGHLQEKTGFGFAKAHRHPDFTHRAVFVFQHPVELRVEVAVYFRAGREGFQGIGHHEVVDDDIDLHAIRHALFVEKKQAVAVVKPLVVFDPVAVGFHLQQFSDVLPLRLGAFPGPDLFAAVVDKVIRIAPVEAAVQGRLKLVERPARRGFFVLAGMGFEKRVQLPAQIGRVVFHVNQVFEPPFNFERRNARPDQIGQLIRQIQVFDRQQVAAFDERSARTVDQLVGQPAVLGAGAAVGRALAVGDAHVAVAAKRHAQSAGDKKLQLGASSFVDFPDLVQVEFPR